MVDLDKLEHILEIMENGEKISEDDEQYLAEVHEEIKLILAREDCFPDWMNKTFLGYVIGAMIGVFMNSYPKELMLSYLFFRRSQQQEEKDGRN